MLDHEVSATCVVAWGLWAMGATIVVADLLVPGQDDIGHAGLVCAAAAATIHVRGFIRGLEVRERNAFEMGRDTGTRSIARLPR